jgi:hypothetical protein
MVMRGGNNHRQARKTLLTILILLLTVVASSTAYAVRIRHRTPVLVEKEAVTRWAFQGAIDELLDDDNDYSGFQFSISHFYSGDKALRLSLGVFNHERHLDEAHVFRSNDLLYILDGFGDYDNTGATISLQGMFYSSPRKEPRLYLGFGPRFSASDANPFVRVTYYDDYNYDWAEPLAYDDATQIAFGIEGTVGFEWFLGRSLSMFAEYGATLQNEWYILEINRYNVYGHRVIETEALDDGLHFDDSHIKLGLSLYF